MKLSRCKIQATSFLWIKTRVVLNFGVPIYCNLLCVDIYASILLQQCFDQSCRLGKRIVCMIQSRVLFIPQTENRLEFKTQKLFFNDVRTWRIQTRAVNANWSQFWKSWGNYRNNKQPWSCFKAEFWLWYAKNRLFFCIISKAIYSHRKSASTFCITRVIIIFM